MHTLSLEDIKCLLCIGAHPDDIEIGCGGTVASLLSAADIHVEWVVFSGSAERQREARQSAEAYLTEAETRHVRLLAYEDGFFPASWSQIKREMHQLGQECSPDLIFTHRLEDRHQDHRTLAELTWNEFRNHSILEYEVPKYEGDLGQPNLFVPISSAIARKKIEHLVSAFPSQADKPWFDARLFEGHLRLRGIECRSELAEAFYARKCVLRI